MNGLQRKVEGGYSTATVGDPVLARTTSGSAHTRLRCCCQPGLNVRSTCHFAIENPSSISACAEFWLLPDLRQLVCAFSPPKTLLNLASVDRNLFENVVAELYRSVERQYVPRLDEHNVGSLITRLAA